jgi:hypothetical protein
LFFLKIEDNGATSLFIIYQRALLAIVFQVRRLPRIAGWLRQNLQVEQQKSAEKKGAKS